MLRFASLAIVFVALVLPQVTWAQERDSIAPEVRAVFERAIKAHGVENLAKIHHVRMKLDGKFMDEYPFNAEVWSAPGKFRNIITTKLFNQKIVITSVVVGDKGWKKDEFEGAKDTKATEMTAAQVVDAKKQQEMLLLTHSLLKMAQSALKENGGGLADKDAVLAEVQENEKPAISVAGKSDGGKLSIVFDKESGLIVRLKLENEKNKVDDMLFRDHLTKDGVRIAGRVEFLSDGKKQIHFQVAEVEFPEKFDDKLFEAP